MGLEASYLNMSWWVRGLHINPKALGEMYKPIHKPHQGGEKKKSWNLAHILPFFSRLQHHKHFCIIKLNTSWMRLYCETCKNIQGHVWKTLDILFKCIAIGIYYLRSITCFFGVMFTLTHSTSFEVKWAKTSSLIGC
jgi:hypothetical protein